MVCMRCGKEEQFGLRIEAYRLLSDTDRCSFPSEYWDICDNCLNEIKDFAKRPRDKVVKKDK